MINGYLCVIVVDECMEWNDLNGIGMGVMNSMEW